MSRTDKTRPYWVKVNDHGVEHHDHESFGEKVYRNRPAKDEDGNYIYEVAPTYVRAAAYLHHRAEVARNRTLPLMQRNFVPSITQLNEGGRMIYTAYDEAYLHGGPPTNQVIAEAERAVAAGDPRRLIEIGRYRRRKMEEYLAYTIADHCTIDEKPNKYGRYVNVNPCYKEADWWGEDRDVYKYRCSCCSPQGFNTAKRAIARDTLKEVAKQYNSGEDDWEDAFDARENITPRRKAGQSWW